MNSVKVQNLILTSHGVKPQTVKPKTGGYATQSTPAQSVSFQGGSSSISKRGWFFLRNLSDYMKDASEITNAIIAAIGTGIIAPAIILVSPGKGDKEDKDKKFFQAIRQPLSAGLALAFQLPMTKFITRGIDSRAYKYKWNMFNDEVLGELIPDKKYLQKGISKETLQAWEAKFEDTSNGKSLKQQLEDQIRNNYKEGEIELSDEQLAKQVEKKKGKFLREKIVEEQRNKLIEAKAEELKTKISQIKDSDLVTDDYRNLAKQKYSSAYSQIEKDAKLSWFDKTIRMMGFSNKKTKNLEKLQKEWATQHGLDILKNEAESQKLFSDPMEKLKRFIENKDKDAQKIFKGKKYWFSLLVNLFMVSASCYALNWAHPRLKELIDKCKNNDNNQQNQQINADKKVEVK